MPSIPSHLTFLSHTHTQTELGKSQTRSGMTLCTPERGVTCCGWSHPSGVLFPSPKPLSRVVKSTVPTCRPSSSSLQVKVQHFANLTSAAAPSPLQISLHQGENIFSSCFTLCFKMLWEGRTMHRADVPLLPTMGMGHLLILMIPGAAQGFLPTLLPTPPPPSCINQNHC